MQRCSLRRPHVCFIIDAYSRAIFGWRFASHMRTTMVPDAIVMARWQRGAPIPRFAVSLGRRGQVTTLRFGERLAEIGAVPSIGKVGDSYDNALAETVGL